MYDLIVVGGGFWGVAQALFAEAHGKRVLLIDTPREGRASVAAAGMFSSRWFQGAMRKKAVLAHQDAQMCGVKFNKPGADVINYMGERSFESDMWTFYPQQFLALRPADRHERVVFVSECSVETDGGDRFLANDVVLCCGIYTDELLQGSGFQPIGVKPLWGSAVILPVNSPNACLQAYTNPYAHYTIREWGKGATRIGETLEKKPGQREAYLNKMMTRMAEYLPTGEYDPYVMSGARPTLEGGMTVKKVAGGPYVATGGGRSGAVMSFWAAREVYTQMSKEYAPEDANQGA